MKFTFQVLIKVRFLILTATLMVCSMGFGVERDEKVLLKLKSNDPVLLPKPGKEFIKLEEKDCHICYDHDGKKVPVCESRGEDNRGLMCRVHMLYASPDVAVHKTRSLNDKCHAAFDSFKKTLGLDFAPREELQKLDKGVIQQNVGEYPTGRQLVGGLGYVNAESINEKEEWVLTLPANPWIFKGEQEKKRELTRKEKHIKNEFESKPSGPKLLAYVFDTKNGDCRLKRIQAGTAKNRNGTIGKQEAVRLPDWCQFDPNFGGAQDQIYSIQHTEICRPVIGFVAPFENSVHIRSEDRQKIEEIRKRGKG